MSGSGIGAFVFLWFSELDFAVFPIKKVLFL